jgi:hypothetical protein
MWPRPASFDQLGIKPQRSILSALPVSDGTMNRSQQNERLLEHAERGINKGAPVWRPRRLMSWR